MSESKILQTPRRKSVTSEPSDAAQVYTLSNTTTNLQATLQNNTEIQLILLPYFHPRLALYVLQFKTPIGGGLYIIFQPQFIAKNTVISNFFKKLSTLQNPRMLLQRHLVVGLDPLVVVDNAVQVYDQGDGKRAVLADDGHAKLNAHEGLNIESIIQTADGFQILTFKYS